MLTRNKYSRYYSSISHKIVLAALSSSLCIEFFLDTNDLKVVFLGIVHMYVATCMCIYIYV